MLHTISKILPDSLLQHCIAIIKSQPDAALLLYQDGAYLAMSGTSYAEQLDKLTTTNSLYVLEGDVKARAIADKLLKNISYVSYADFVQLTMQHNKIISW